MSQHVAAAAVVNPAAPPIYGPAVAARRAPLTVDESGRLIVTAAPGAPIIISGSTTPGDAVANPTACVDTRSFPELWSGANWNRVRGISQNAPQSLGVVGLETSSTLRAVLPYAGNISPLTAEYVGPDAGFQNGAGIYVVNASPRSYGTMQDAGARLVGPAPLSSAGANAGVIRAARARLEALIYSFTDVANVFFVLVNKATAPTNGDVPIWARPATAGLSLAAGVVSVGSEQFGDAGIHFPTGIAWALSTTVNVVTLAAVPGACFVQGMYS